MVLPALGTPRIAARSTRWLLGKGSPTTIEFVEVLSVKSEHSTAVVYSEILCAGHEEQGKQHGGVML